MIELGTGLSIIGAGLAVGLSGLSSGIGTGIAGNAGAGAISEEAKNFSKALIFQAFPQTQAIYGLLVSILILVGTGLLSGGTPTLAQGTMALGAGLAVGFSSFSAIGQGIAAASGVSAGCAKKEALGKSMVFSVLPETQAIYGLLVAVLIMLGAGIIGTATGATFESGLVAIGAGLAIGIAGLSGIGQGIAASAGIGATAENSKVFGKGMIFSVLPETQAIYGLLIAVLLLFLAGGMAATGKTTLTVGLGSVGAGLAIGIAGLSAIGQGITAAGGIGASSKDPSSTSRCLILSVIPETFAIFGLLIAVIILVKIGVLG